RARPRLASVQDRGPCRDSTSRSARSVEPLHGGPPNGHLTGSNLRSIFSRVLHIVFPSWRRSLIAAAVGVTCFVLRPLAAHLLVSLLRTSCSSSRPDAADRQNE